MTRYILDMNIASYLIKGIFPVIRTNLVRVPLEQICVSAVTEGELRYGVARRTDATRLKRSRESRSSGLPIGPGSSRRPECGRRRRLTDPEKYNR